MFDFMESLSERRLLHIFVATLKQFFFFFFYLFAFYWLEAIIICWLGRAVWWVKDHLRIRLKSIITINQAPKFLVEVALELCFINLKFFFYGLVGESQKHVYTEDVHFFAFKYNYAKNIATIEY